MAIDEPERERTLRRLRELYAADALTNEQFEARVRVALAATSARELAELVTIEGHSHHAPAADPPGIEALATVERHLLGDERIEWIGRPDPSRHLTRADVYLIPFSLAWGGGAIGGGVAAIASGSPAMVVGVPFIGAGLYFIIGRFVHKAHRRRRTVYAVTDRRVMSIIRRRRGEVVDTAYLAFIPSVLSDIGRNGRGSVNFGNGSAAPRMLGESGLEMLGNSSAGLTFHDIADAQLVADLVERLRDTAIHAHAR